MVSVGFVLFNLIDDNETGKADARLASRQAVAVNLARDLRQTADPIAVAVGKDPEVAAAIRAGDESRLERRLRQLRRSEGAKRIAIVSKRVPLADTGGSDAVFPTFRELLTSDGETQGTVQVSVIDAPRVRRARRRRHGARRRRRDRRARRRQHRPRRGAGVAAAERGQSRGRSASVCARRATTRPGSTAGWGASRSWSRIRRPGRPPREPPADRRAAARVPDPRDHARLVRRALAARPARALPDRRSPHRRGRLLGARPDRRRAMTSLRSATSSTRCPSSSRASSRTCASSASACAGDAPDRRRAGVEPRPRRAAQVVVSAATDGVGAGAGRASVRRGSGGPLVTVAAAGDLRGLGRMISDAEPAPCTAGEPIEGRENGVATLALPLQAARRRHRGRRLDRPRGGALHGRRARARRVPGGAGRDVDRERRAARARRGAGGHRRADRPRQPPPLRGPADRGGRALAPLARARRPADARHRQLQAGQRPLRPHRGRQRARARSPPYCARPRARSTSPPVMAARSSR